jgi:CheY-like chemotaxis protein
MDMDDVDAMDGHGRSNAQRRCEGEARRQSGMATRRKSSAGTAVSARGHNGPRLAQMTAGYQLLQELYWRLWLGDEADESLSVAFRISGIAFDIVRFGSTLERRVVGGERSRIVKRGTILLIEDSPKDQQVVQDVLHAQGYSVTTISDPERAFSTVEEWAKQYNFVIIQEAMRGRSGMELVHAARVSCKDLPVLVVTRDGDWNGYAQALSEGVVDYFPTPVDHKKLVKAVAGALAQAV